MTAETGSVPILYNGTPPFPLKFPLTMGRSGTPSFAWLLGPTRVLNPNGISIGLAVFAGLVTLRQTDHTTRSVTIGRIYVSSTAMRPKNG